MDQATIEVRNETAPAALQTDPVAEGSSTPDGPDFGHFGDEHKIIRLEVEVEARLFKSAPEYKGLMDLSRKKEADAKRIREQLAYDFALYKAIKVGRGRDGEWGPFVEKLGLAVRTVDRWVTNKLATGDLPEWVTTRLKANQDPPSPPPPDPTKPFEIELVGLTDEERIAFNEAADKLGDLLSRVIFEAVTRHEVALAPAQPKVRMTFRDDAIDVFRPSRLRSSATSRSKRQWRRRANAKRQTQTQQRAAGIFTVPAAPVVSRTVDRGEHSANLRRTGEGAVPQG